jgi:hyperosmotically inducible protein
VTLAFQLSVVVPLKQSLSIFRSGDANSPIPTGLTDGQPPALSVKPQRPRASHAGGDAQPDNNIQAELQNQLKKFKDVQVSVQGGVVDLEGTVQDFATKEEIDKKAHRVKDVTAVQNKLKIASAGELSDAQLQQKIVQKLQYDRVGYGNAFNAISVGVQDGVVTLAGNALGPVAADSAVSLPAISRACRM